MTLFAYGEGALKGPAGDGLMHGLKLVAVAIVAQAVLGMAQSLAPDRPRATIAVLSLILMAFAPAAWAQIAVIVLGALAGLVVCRQGAEIVAAAARRGADIPAMRRSFLPASFFALLALSFVPAGSRARPRSPPLSTARARWCSAAAMWCCRCFGPPWSIRAGSPTNAFLAGYGAAQAVPGPLFTFAAYLGAVAGVGPGGVAGAALALVAIFAPGLLLLMAALPFWNGLRAPRQRARGDGRRQRRRGRPARFRAL